MHGTAVDETRTYFGGIPKMKTTGKSTSMHWAAGWAVAVVLILICGLTNLRADPCARSGQVKNAAKIPMLILVLQPEGFRQANVQIDSDSFFLIVENRTGLADVTLVLARSDGITVDQRRLYQGIYRYKSRALLPAGQYYLLVANYSSWSCKITVNSK
jgi:hypothetical protein